MFKPFLASILAFSLLAPIGHLFHKPATVEDRVASSVLRITGNRDVVTPFGPMDQGYGCTGWQLAPKRVMTAAHCIGTNMRADGLIATILKVDENLDLALLDVDNNKPSLTLREGQVVRFENIIAVGYGFGWRQLTILHFKVLLPAYSPTEGAPAGMITQGAFINGMSGGPIVDVQGKVVGIVQRSNSGTGYGVGTIFIRAFLVGLDIGL